MRNENIHETVKEFWKKSNGLTNYLVQHLQDYNYESNHENSLMKK